MPTKHLCLLPLGLALTGCAGLFHMNLAPKREPPPAIAYTEEIQGSHGPSHDRYYWFAKPEWFEKVATTQGEANDLGGWRARFTTADAIVWLQKDDRDLLQTTCYWQPASAMRVAPGRDGEYESYVTVVASSSGDRFTMDCDFFEKAPH